MKAVAAAYLMYNMDEVSIVRNFDFRDGRKELCSVREQWEILVVSFQGGFFGTLGRNREERDYFLKKSNKAENVIFQYTYSK